MAKPSKCVIVDYLNSGEHIYLSVYIFISLFVFHIARLGVLSRVAQGAYLEVEYIRNVLSVSGTLKYADSGTA